MCFTWALILDCCLPQHLPVSNHYQALPIFNFPFLKSGHSSLSSSNQPIALLAWFIARVFPIGLLPSHLNHLKSILLDIIRVINLEICVWLHSSLLLLQGFPFIFRMTSKLLSRLNKAPQRLTSPSSPTTPCLHSTLLDQECLSISTPAVVPCPSVFLRLFTLKGRLATPSAPYTSGIKALPWPQTVYHSTAPLYFRDDLWLLLREWWTNPQCAHTPCTLICGLYCPNGAILFLPQVSSLASLWPPGYSLLSSRGIER